MSTINLATVLANLNGNSFLGIDTITDVKLKGGKSNPLQGRVKKVVAGSTVQVFQNKHVNGYDAMVKRRLVAEGKCADDFQLSPRAWGVRLEGEPVIEHKGEKYLEVIFRKAGEVTYLVDGIPTDKAKITGLDDDKPEGEQGGLSDGNKVIIRTYKLSSVRRIRVDGTEYAGSFTH